MAQGDRGALIGVARVGEMALPSPYIAATMAKQDPRLVAKTQQYEVAYFARKHRITAAAARSILQRGGRSPEKADELAEAGKKR